MGNAPSTSFLARSGLLGLMMLPLAALSLWLATRRADGPDLSRLPGLLQGMGGDIRIRRGPSGETMFRLLLPIAVA